MKFFDNALGNPEEKKPAKDIPVSKPAAKPEPAPAKSKYQGEIPQIHGEPKTEKKAEENLKTPPSTPSVSKEDLKKALAEKEEINAKLSVNIPVRKVFGTLPFEDKMRLILADPEAERIIAEIVRQAVEKTPDTLVEAFGKSLLSVAMSCDDLREQLLDIVVKNDEWAAAFADVLGIEQEPSDGDIEEFADKVLEDKNATKILIEKLLASPKGCDAIYNGIRNS